ncbi:Long wavelength sensitive opsin 9 [Ladona fulva]|uniref:Long wavelength sensitive opsin 9 n=1 Tax=Ladona fulva TaxID=123851 RepID=A0A0C9LJJ3_LADFU|nr:Long wavelength sensitive opsin 9 [Ladona fulva]FAA01170.1 TPA: opsin, long-wavelength sensitive type [Ladona fulva]
MSLAVGSGPSFSAYSWSGNNFNGNMTVVDKVPPEILFLVDSHWYQFPPLNPLWHALLGFFISLLGFISICGNGVVIYVFSCTKSLRTPSNLFVVNLAISDFMLMATMAPMMAINCYFETWILGPFMCQIYGMLGSMFGCASIWTMTVIAMDRYNVIVKGLAARPLTIKSALFWIFQVWLNSAIWTVAPILGWNRYVPEGNMTSCGTDYLTKDWVSVSYIWAYSFFVYGLPLSVIIYAYWFIVKAVSTHERQMREQAKKMNVASLRSSEAQQTSTEIKLAKIAMMTISLWFMAWTPYLIINLAGLYAPRSLSPLASIWGAVFAKANAVYNPIVYGISHPKYRAALYQKFPSLSCTSESNTESQSQASAATAVSDEKTSA